MARKIPFEDPQVLNFVRIAYVAVQAIVLGAYFMVTQKVCLVVSIHETVEFDRSVSCT